MSTNLQVSDDEEIYLITLHRFFKLKTLHLIQSLNEVLDSCIKTRTQDIAKIVNGEFNLNLTDATVDEILNRLKAGEMQEVFHSFNLKEVISNYIGHPVMGIQSRLICFNPFTTKCLQCGQECIIKHSRSIQFFDIHSVKIGLVHASICKQCKIEYFPNFYLKSSKKVKTVTPESIYHQRAIYFGGEKVYSVDLLMAYTSALLRQYSGLDNFHKAYNLVLRKKWIRPQTEHHLVCENYTRKLKISLRTSSI